MRGQADQLSERTVERVVRAVEIDVGGASAGGDPGEHPGATLEEPLGLVVLGEHPAEEAPEVLLTDPVLSGHRLVGGEGAAGRVADRGFDAGGALVGLGHASRSIPAIASS